MRSNKILLAFRLVTTALFLASIVSASSGGSNLPTKRDTSNEPEKNQTSVARVNPNTLAMEMALPIYSYPGRGGNSLVIEFRYSSSLWRMDNPHTWWYWAGAQRQYVSDVFGLYAEHSAAGWTSSLLPPRLDENKPTYNSLGSLYGDSVNEAEFVDEYQSALWLLLEQAQNPEFDPPSLGCVLYCSTRTRIVGGGNYGPSFCTGWQRKHCSNPFDLPDPSVPPLEINQLYYVKRLRVMMPDGSSTEFRHSDQPIYCGEFQTGCTGTYQGAFRAVDGSGMTLVNSGSGYELLMADGSRYTFPSGIQSTGALFADSFTDVNGNRMTFTETAGDGTDGTWTDTLGRSIIDPIPHVWYSQTQPVGTFDFDTPGLGLEERTYHLTWKHLKPRGCENSDSEDCVGHDGTTVGGALEDQRENLFYPNRFLCTGNIKYDLVNDPEDPREVLFTQFEDGVRPCNTIDIKRDEHGEPILDEHGNPIAVGVRFNPVVLSDVELPNGQSYQFKYNRYGEITRITYPTGAYETFVYAQIPYISGKFSLTYNETNRGVTERKLYNASNELQQTWTYLAERYTVGGVSKYRITTTTSLASNPAAPGAKTENYIFIEQVADDRFGYSDPRVGRSYDERAYDENGALRSRVLTEYVTKDSTPWGGLTARRDVRVTRTASMMFEPGSSDALVTLSELAYDDNGSSDPSYFSHLNVKSKKGYHYVAVSASTAASDSLTWATIASWFPSSKLASITETDYAYDANYKARGIPSLPIETRALDPADNSVLSKTQTIYDNQLLSGSPNYPSGFAVENYGLSSLDCTPNQTPATICWQSPGSTIFGRPTTSRTWKKEDNSWIESHSRYDVFGNVIAARDPIGNEATTAFSSDNKYAYPTSVTSPAPDPTNTTGTNLTSTVTTVYDLNTGLPTSVTDDFGQVTKTEYTDPVTNLPDPFLRPRRVFGDNFTAPETQTSYDDNARTVTVRKQLDATNWDEATTFMDSLGRTVKTQAKDSQGDVFVETHYDLLGRVDRVTNPYRLGDIVYWNKTRYDAAGRVVETYAPATLADINANNLVTLGTTAFGISTVTNYVGTFVMTTDASLRKGRSITNALGHLLRVDEPTGISSDAEADLGAIATPLQPTSYKYDAYGKMVEVTQGVQKRWFKYDSLGRLLRVRQPEQEVNTALNLSDPFNTSGQWTAGFTYDVLGNVIRATDANGVNIVNEYDRASRVTKRCYTKPNVNSTATTCAQIQSTDQSTDTPAVTFLYDGKGLAQQQSPNYAKGKLTEVSNGISTTENMTFDNFGRLTRSKQITDGVEYGGGTDTTRWMTYTYNLSGTLIEEQYPSGRKVKNDFESDGDLRRIFGNAYTGAPERTYANAFSYTPDGKIQKLRLGNNLWESAEFNERLQVKALNLGHGPAAGDLWRLGYEYGELDAEGLVNQNKNTGNIARQTVSFNGLTHPFVQSYKYDSLYRLTEAKETKNSVQTWIQGFGYDRYGNRTSTSQTINGATINTTPAVDEYTNRFTSASVLFDKNGNQTRDIAPNSQSRTTVFNGDNKQSEVKDANGVTIGRYFYDGEGKRIKKKVYDGGVQTEETVFVYSSGKLIAEYTTATPPPNPTTSYTVTDMLGSPRVLTNSLGEVISRRDFAPFGEELLPDGSNRSTNQQYVVDGLRKKFTGYEKDTETGLDFAEARMYENRYGRFTAVDPLITSGKSPYPQTFNRYVYTMNRPLTYRDPTGLQAGDESEIVAWIKSWPAWFDSAMAPVRERVARLLGGEQPVPVPQSFVPTDVFSAPDGTTRTRMKQSNVILDSISTSPTTTTVYPWGTPDQVDKAARTLGKEPTNGFSLIWTSYQHSIGKASSTDLAREYAIFGTNFVGGIGGKGAAKTTVYLSRSADDLVRYVGITDDLARRAAEQLRQRGIDIEPLIPNLSRADGRAVEQALIEIHGLGKNGGTLLNKINSIAKQNPVYAEQLRRGQELLQSIGYK